MENKYEYSGVVDIDKVLIDIYKRKLKEGEKLKSSPYMRETLELHNKGLTPLEIAKVLSKKEGAGKIVSNRVRGWLDVARVKPNEGGSRARHKEYKLLDKDFYEKLIIKSMGAGKGLFDVLQTEYASIVTYTDSTTEKIESSYILSQLMKKADKNYIAE